MKTTNTTYRALAAIAALLCLSSTNAQTNTQYFMKWNPQQHQLNPAFQPAGKFYIGVPGLSSINFNLGNNNLVFTDVIQNVTVDGKKKTVLFLDKNAKRGSVDDFLDAMGSNTRIFYDHRINLIDFGFKLADGFATFNISNRASTNLLLPKAIPELALKGIEEGEKFKMKGNDFAVDLTAYTELGLGYSRALNDKLNVGAKFKILYGHGNVHTNFSDVTITGNETMWELKGDGDVRAAIPGIRIYENELSQIDSMTFDEDLKTRDFTRPKGFGFAVDLGATYKVLPELTVSASVLDLGFIHWTRSLNRFVKKGDFVWDGITFDINDDTTDYGIKYQEMFDEMFNVDHKPSSYSTWLNSKFLLGGEYSLWNDRLGLGLLAKGQFYRGKLYGNGTASVNFRPWKQLSATVAYGLFDGEWNNLGAGLNLNAGPVNLFCSVDNIPFRYAKGDGALIPSNTEKVQVSLGMNLFFGYTPKKEKKKKQKEPEKPVLVEVTDTTTDMNIVSDTAVVSTEKIDSSIVSDSNLGIDTSVVEKPVKSKELSDNLKKLQSETSNIKFLNYKEHLIAIHPISYATLDIITKELNDDPDVKVTIECHSAIIRDTNFTYWMTEERANLIRGYFIEGGIDASRITTVGMGADKPVAKGNTPSANKANTRVVLIFEK